MSDSTPSVDSLLIQNQQSMLRGRFRRRRSLERCWANRDGALSSLPRLAAEIQESCEVRRRRAEQSPCVVLDENLPIFQAATAIEAELREHQVLVVTGETGSGKSTQLPLILLRAGWGIEGYIGHTQPRRIAARSIAHRVAQQLHSPLGRFAGFKTRFSDQVDAEAYIKLMTDGILLAEIQSDRFLEQYQALIIDEAHERSLNIDFLLGYLKQLLPRRPELKLVITSATIDAQRFADHFSNDRPVPVLEVSGRSYPIEVRHLEGSESLPDDDAHGATVSAVLALLREVPGDGLVFLPTEFDIRSLAKQLRGALLASGDRTTEILPLYARLTPEQQNLVFAPHRARRIVLATNVAESSLTVPEIRFVVDTGTARISRYAPRSKVQRLPIEAISRASADQRAGRCGRVGPGTCLRLYSAADYAARPPFTTPEIRRTNLASVILRMTCMRLGELDAFPFLDPPSREAVRDGYETLFEIQALDADKQLTDIGKILGRVPTDPRVARMLLAAEELDCLNEVAIIAAGLEIPDPRVRPPEQAALADECHAQWANPNSDFLTLLALFDFYQGLKTNRSRSQMIRECQRNFLSHHHLREWSDVHRQILSMIGEMGWRVGPRREHSDAIHQALLSGLLSGVAQRQDKGHYLGAGGLQWQIWPGSALAAQPPAWIVAGEVVETSRRYGRTVAKIQPQWLERLAAHLLEYAYEEPHWSESRQCCVALERATLFGLPVIVKRTVPYAPVDPAEARRVFLEAGLVAGNVRGPFAFLDANQAILRRACEWAAKTRDRKFIVDDWTLERFYEQRLPADAFDTAALKQLLRKDPELDRRLRLTLEDLFPDLVPLDEKQFPESIEVHGVRWPLRYRFEPGSIDDGISVDIPASALGQLSAQDLDWLVPGQLGAKIAELIRTLPKSLRRQLVPVQAAAERVRESLVFGKGTLPEAVAQTLSKFFGERISAKDFQLEELPDHVRMNIRAVDEQGRVIDQSRDCRELLRKCAPQTTATTTEAEEESTWNQSGWTSWRMEELPERIVIRRGRFELPVYPMLRDEGAAVSLKLADDLTTAQWNLVRANARLFQLAHRKNVQQQVRWIPELQELNLAIAPWVASAPLAEILAHRLAWLAFLDDAADVRTKSAFEQRLAEAAKRVPLAAQTLASWVRELARGLHQVRLRLESQRSGLRVEIRADVERQLSDLFGDDLRATEWIWLCQYPRYVAAIAARLDKASSNAVRDLEGQKEVHRHWDSFEQWKSRLVPAYPINARLVEFRWMLEELRVSLFAQQLGTRVPVSSKRLEKLWTDVQAR